MKNLFINLNSGRIRAGWRILLFLLIFMILNLALMTGVRTLLGSLKGGGILWFTLLGIAATLAVFLSRKYVDKKDFTSLGLVVNKTALMDVVAGIIISAAIMTCMYFTLLYTGLIQFEGFSWWTESAGPEVTFGLDNLIIALTILLQFMIVAWWEELVFRGVFLQNISEGLNLKWGIILSTLFFGFVHFSNPDASLLSTFLILLITLKLVYAYLKTGQLWLAIGLHLGWNFFQASVFGFASSGHTSPSMIAQTPLGPEWLSGGEFGAEHSILIVPVTLVSLFVINWWTGKTRISEENSFLKFLITEENFKATPEETKEDEQVEFVLNTELPT